MECVQQKHRRVDVTRLNGDDAAAWVELARQGDFEGAWRVSDRILARGRLRDHTAPRHHQQIWDGTPIVGRRVLIRCYHGLGDTVQFVRYAPMVRAVASEVVVWAQPALLELLSGVHGIDRLLPLDDGSPTAVYDVDVEIMELPYVFRTTLDSIPRACPYLQARPLPLTGDRPRIGLVWRAGGWDRRRSIPFAELTPLLDLHGCSWYCLQHDPEPGEQHRRLEVVDTRGIAQTAGYLCGLDLVITIDSLPAHLAGALGVPVWTLLTTPADWRWMTARSDSPWYPTMRLFRQHAGGAWGRVIEEVRDALQKRFGLRP
jgi:hypothetical protein